MANKIYVVDLSEEERTFLTDFVNRGERSARKLKRAHILLLADEGKTDSQIAECCIRARPRCNAPGSGLWRAA